MDTRKLRAGFAVKSGAPSSLRAPVIEWS